MRLQGVRTLLRGTTGDLIIGIGLAAAALLVALALWPRSSGISGIVSEYSCDPVPGKKTTCPVRPAVAQIRMTDCYSGVLTSSNPRDNMTWDTRSDAKGRYHVDLDPGTYCVDAFKEGRGGFPVTDSRMYVPVRAGQVTSVDLTLSIPVGVGLVSHLPTPIGQRMVGLTLVDGRDGGQIVRGAACLRRSTDRAG